MGHSLQEPGKENGGAQHPDRNAQLEAPLAALARSCCRLAGCAIADFGQLSHGAANARRRDMDDVRLVKLTTPATGGRRR